MAESESVQPGPRAAESPFPHRNQGPVKEQISNGSACLCLQVLVNQKEWESEDKLVTSDQDAGQL